MRCGRIVDLGQSWLKIHKPIICSYLGIAELNTLILYSPKISERLQYIIHTLLPGCQLTTSTETFASHNGIRLNYSHEPLTTEALWIKPQGLLTASGISPQEILCTDWQQLPVFFITNGDLPFDILAASFYLLSRYEEYLPHTKDQYGRYAHTNSIAYQFDFLKRPLVNEWMQAFTKMVKQKFPQLNVRDDLADFRFIPTYDIDEAYKYHYQPLWKNVLGFFRDLLRGDFIAVMERGNVYSGNSPDPYNSFDWLDELHQSYHCQPIYFFLTLLKKGQYDKNLLSGNKGIRLLYQRIAKQYTIGLHPSWQSGSESGLLQKERDVLVEMTGQPVLRSRNHYLRFTIPQTYRNLIRLGIQEEYSMAYGNVNGFRASYAKPFQWYDLENEQVTGLLVHPFCFMEACSFFNQGFSAIEAGEELQYFHDTVRSVGGELIILFHNHFLTTQPEWIEWRKMYVSFLQKNFGSNEKIEN